MVCMLVMNDVRSDGRVQKEARALADAGANVVILGVPKGDSKPWATDAFEVRLIRGYEPSVHTLRPLRIATNLYREHEMWDRLATAAVSVGADVIHCHDLNTARSGMKAARTTKSRLVYDAHELFTERNTITRWRARLFEREEGRILRRADVVFSANSERAEIMARKYSTSREIIPLLNVPPSSAWVDRPEPEAVTARERTGCEKLLMYQGSLADGRGLDAIVGALECLPESYHLCLMGPGEPGPGLRRLLGGSSVAHRVHLWPPVSVGEVSGWAAVADAGIVTYLPDSLNNTYCAPNKLYEYAAAGIPIIGADLPVIRRVLETHSAGTVFVPGDPVSVAAATAALLGDEVVAQRARRGALILRAETSWETEAAKLLTAYTQMLER